MSIDKFKRDAFKAYDIRGRVPDELNEAMAARIGMAFVKLLGAKKVVVGRDVRLSSEPLAQAVVKGLNDMGCDVLDIGLCGTEMVYFAASHLGADGGIMVTASHNPMDYNGLKLVREQSKPISGDTGLREMEELVVAGDLAAGCEVSRGKAANVDIMAEYVKHLMTYVNPAALKPLKIVVNAGNGCAGPVIDALEKLLPFEFIKVNHQPDGTFPNGIPNPLLVENREATAKVVRETGADLGVAWDGDFDRCFLFDEKGGFIEGYYIVGLLGAAFLRRFPGARIIHDPRLTWNTIEVVQAAGGLPVQSKTGHAFIKERMRREDAVYGGEMSAHHYFREFFYCDSGMIPWLIVVENLCHTGKTLSEMVAERMEKYPVSGEINRKVVDGQAVLKAIEEKYVTAGAIIDRTDGLSVEYTDWRFNLRMSNTEPLLRLNVESRGNRKLMEEKSSEILAVIEQFSGC
ncbi:MAG TPA: phosphomannomutase [Methylomusa anaerophila]|uniref:Phosphomannomutase/phosphoglucomutase n=1 Tax=Methylomusa anaerophila TaxID=1930071 RepID=A0A348AKS0_9FIRM|nr:phosphomannomutase [Methylomusa anaerophila]BBB91668.1 phosphomannomutase/phosphoglucomutase [Methylomusa anaerophila]HML88598.1 phosphomannomutase [Methylomusa anaerophila]